jgi:hypothetical protein
MTILALVAGFIGGLFSNRFLFLGPMDSQNDVNSKSVIVANEFHLVDEDGKDRWVLKLSGAGEPNITFINNNGWAPMAIGVNKEGFPFFNMIQEPHQPGGPSFILMDGEMKNRAVLGLKEDGEPNITFLDNNGQVRAIFGSTDLKNPFTGLTEKRPGSSLVLFDEDGKIIWSAPKLVALPIRFSQGRHKTK